MLPAVLSRIRVSRKRLILLVLFILILLGSIIWRLATRVNVVAYDVNRENAIKGVTVSGNVASLDDVLLATDVTGRIKEVRFREGDFVLAGQTLATLDLDEAFGSVVSARGQLQTAEAQVRNLQTEPRVLQVAIAQAQVREAQQNISILQQELQRASIQLQNAASEETRLQRLYQQGAVSFREFERAGFASAEIRQQIAGLESQIQAAGARLTQTRENLNLIQAGTKREQIQAAQGQVQAAKGGVETAVGILEDYIVRAPVTGYIAQKILDIGEIASPNSAILRLVTPESLYISTQVEENELINIKVGQNAYIIFDAYPERTFTGIVTQVLKNVDPITGTFETKITAPAEKDLRVIVGMTADVTIVVQEIKNSIIIPNEFVYTKNKQKYVLRKVGNKAVKTCIEGVAFDNNRFRVIKGVTKGDIIVKGAQGKKVNPNERIKVTENYREQP